MHEKARHECAVRQLCKWRAEWGLEKFRKYISTHTLKQELLVDFANQWKLGNRGEPKEWR
jgi:hypothetical protein